MLYSQLYFRFVNGQMQQLWSVKPPMHIGGQPADLTWPYDLTDDEKEWRPIVSITDTPSS